MQANCHFSDDVHRCQTEQQTVRISDGRAKGVDFCFFTDIRRELITVGCDQARILPATSSPLYMRWHEGHARFTMSVLQRDRNGTGSL